MNEHIYNLIPKSFKNYKIKKLESGASYKEYYRLNRNKHSVILMNSSKQPREFNHFLNIHNILSKTNLSIPQIIETDIDLNILILEDFGRLRFDKILNKYSLIDLLYPAVDSLVILKNEIEFNQIFPLPIYNFNILKSEISEFIEFFYLFSQKKKITLELEEEFYQTWQKQFDSINFNFHNFVHKDYNLNNLIYLTNRKNFKKCGIIDFQNAFWGENCWDLFSLLEDSRIFFDDQHNNYFIKYFFNNTMQETSFEDFNQKYHFLNCSRQTRLLGRWVKLSKVFNQMWYLNFIDITKKRLINSLNASSMANLKFLYKKIIPDLYDS